MNIDERILAAASKAAVELNTKTLCDVQIETAITWCGRALAAYYRYHHLFANPNVAVTVKMQALADAEEFAHEAIEHAGLAGPDVYRAVFDYINSAKVPQ